MILHKSQPCFVCVHNVFFILFGEYQKIRMSKTSVNKLDRLSVKIELTPLYKYLCGTVNII